MPGQTHYKSRVVENLGATPLVAADFALGAGWGNTATATPAAGSSDSRGSVDVLCQGSSIAANPTVVLTFKDGTWKESDGTDRVPFAVGARGDANVEAGFFACTGRTATTATFTFVGTPVTAKTYRLDYVVKP